MDYHAGSEGLHRHQCLIKLVLFLFSLPKDEMKSTRKKSCLLGFIFKMLPRSNKKIMSLKIPL